MNAGGRSLLRRACVLIQSAIRAVGAGHPDRWRPCADEVRATMIGFETIGNATVTCIDGAPVIATDPWIDGDAYFGSWGMLNRIPAAQLDNVLRARYVWLSHGHPDHANPQSIDRLADKKILLPDHVGGRMAHDLRGLGFDVTVMPDRTWMPLSPNIRVMCISDYHQDAVLFIDVGGRLLVDVNDAVERGWGRFARGIISRYKRSFLLRLFGYGDVDMINVVDERGTKLIPPAPTSSAGARQYWDEYLAQKVAFWTRYFRTTHMIPFSSFHRYQREDSVWCNEYVTPLAAIEERRVDGCEVLPAFIRYDCEKDSYQTIPREPAEAPVRRTAEYGDDWSEALERDDVAQIGCYFRRAEFLADRVDWIRFRVGGVEHHVALGAARRSRRGITFEVPRGSLMAAIRHEVFDDLLIGNFMRTTVHGDWGGAMAPQVLYPHFTPWLVRYADNARLRTRGELRSYFDIYRRRAPLDYLVHRLEQGGVQRLRTLIRPGSALFRAATRVYSLLKSQSV
jgi:hypothetical protein